ncbi:endonuclease/exonuclease/phosphatase family protein [Draconibacterium orientale]|uniref:endonuclease/exonuclease/phosphatase family protein n=1 Tax=Draconibacterium orientale TaxID=1168034 RepID=UPI002ABD561C|nr:endonuclease/exonuclease/phosphatase family protein [Draconibacterium orientale]
MKNIVVAVVFLLIFAACSNDSMPEIKPDEPEEQEQKDSVVNSELIKVMSFNLRNEVDSDPQTLEQRKYNIKQVILDNEPDVLGVQEIAADWMSDWLSSELNAAGYDKYLSSGQFGSPKIIYYKRSRFSRTNQGTFQMQFTDNRAGTWVVLKELNTKNSYFFCNSHWTTVSSEERLLGVRVILDEIKTNSGELPLVVLGDFNAQPGAPEITALLDNDGLDLYCAHGEKGETYHRWQNTGVKKIDWILCCKKLSVESAAIIKTSYNGFWPSDHWPITATLKLN